MKARYLFKAIGMSLAILMNCLCFAQDQQQIQLTEQQLIELYNSPELLKQYGISQDQLKQLAAQNGINLGEQVVANAEPNQFKNLNGLSSNQLLRNGNKQYTKNEYVEAEINYRKSLEQDPNRKEGLFNLGNALYEQERYEEAHEKYNEVIQTIKDKKERADAFHNLGNSFLNSKKLDEAIEAYKNTLKLNPTDNDARYNLAYANF